MAVDAGREVHFDGEPAKRAVQYFDRPAQGRFTKLAVNWYVSVPSSVFGLVF